MNSLSWFLYLADVVGNLGFLATGVTVFGVIATIAAFLGCVISRGEYENNPEMWISWKYPLNFAVTALVASVVAVVTPSSKTMYLIAASELSESTLETETAKRIGGKIESILDTLLPK